LPGRRTRPNRHSQILRPKLQVDDLPVAEEEPQRAFEELGIFGKPATEKTGVDLKTEDLACCAVSGKRKGLGRAGRVIDY
jgi:hypothetical protein